MAEQNYSENICSAIDIITQSVVDGLAFDKTITCTIVDDSDKNNGRYKVTDGSSKFIAYSETKTFRNKDIVYVTVPKGDFGEQKVIIGKKTEVEEEPFNYVRPFDNFLPCTNNIWEDINFDGLIAVGRDGNATPQASYLQKSFEDFENHYKGFTHLGIKANFKSLLSAEQIASGNYGIRLEMKCVVRDVHPTGEYQYVLATSTEEGEQYYIWNETDKRYEATTATPNNNENNLTLYKQSKHKTIKKIFDLSCQDMLGNPFAFEIFSNQEKVFDISDIEDILGLDIYFYQNGEFKTKTGKDLPLAEIANLFVSDINILFGYSLQNIDDEFVQLFTTDSLNYQHTNNTEENRKNIDLRWAHKVGDKLQVFTKDNLEAWYDEIFDRNEQDNTPYELLIDSSPQQVENRHYYYIPDAGNASSRFYAWHESGEADDYENIIVYSLNKKFVPVPATEIKKGEWYFKKQTFLISEFIENNYFFSGSEDERQLDDNLLNYDAKVYEKQKDFVTNSFIEDIKEGNRKLSDYIFYLYGQDNSISPVGINSVEEFLPNKRYCFDTYKEIEIDFKDVLNYKDYFISLYCPIDFDEIENEDKINNRIVKPLFSQRIINEEEATIENFYTINTNIFKEVDFNENKYEPNKYYYRKYKLDEIFEIRWYRYNLGVPAADEFCGLYWERIPECSEGNNKTYTDPGETPFHCSLLPDFLYNKTEQIKAILIIKQGDEQTPYYSNVITFENKNEVVNIPTTEQELALKLRIDDGTFGNYYLYDESNNLIDKSQSSIRRSLTALFNKTDFTSSSVLQDATKVTWVFPIENTMLNINIADTGGTYIKPESGSAYGKIVIDEKRNSYQLIYNIENTFSFNKNNNSITCTIEKDGEIFSTTQEFSFGNSGSNGSDYTLVLDLLTADNMVTLDPISNVYSFRDVKESTKNDFGNYFVYDESTGYLRKATEYGTKEYDKDIKYYICTSKDSNNNKNTALTKEYLTLGEAYEKSDISIFNEDGSIKDLAVTIFKLENNVYIPVTDLSEITNTTDNLSNYYIANNLEMLYGYYYSKESNGKKEEAFRILKTSTPVEEIKVRATLYDQSNNKINLDSDKFKFTWSFENNKVTQGYTQQLFIIPPDQTNNEIVLLKRNIANPINSLCILTATLSGFGDYDLEAYLPIPLRANYGVIRYQGPDKIIYSTTGVPNYYKDEINLFCNDIDGNDINYPLFDSNNEPYFSILDNEAKNGKYLVPTLGVKKETNGISYIKLIPKSTYIQGLKPFGIQYTDTKQKIFTQPILNMQNRYFSSTLNKWDGKLSVDEKDNTILAKMIGAGRKNKDNTFSGIMLGDWTGSVNANDGGELSLEEHIGLYGIHNGETSFGFTERGIGFIGKAGKGRILLDGDNSVITSSNWTLNGEYGGHKGLYIKIDDGFILMREDFDSDAFIKLNVLASGGKDNSNLSDEEKYDENGIQISGNYTNLNPKPGLDEDNNPKDSDYPFVIAKDKKNFTKIGWNGNIYLGGTRSGTESLESGYISLNAAAAKYPLDINNHFAVAWDGSLTISKYNINNEFSEQAKEIIQKDDQRITGDGDSSVAKVDGVVKDLNQYDYTVLQPYDNFHGLYATPDGDMYLSRKLVIGSKFSATADGYLRAKSALFDDCNANVFQVRYLPSTGANANINFVTSQVPDYDDQNTSELSTECYGAKIGSMGWLKGVRDIEEKDEDGNVIKDEDGNIKTKTVGTYNLGFKSEKHCGILLDSATNVRIDSANNGGTYLNGNRFVASFQNEIHLQQTNSNSTEGIKLNSQSKILQRAKNEILLSIGGTNLNLSTDWGHRGSKLSALQMTENQGKLEVGSLNSPTEDENDKKYAYASGLVLNKTGEYFSLYGNGIWDDASKEFLHNINIIGKLTQLEENSTTKSLNLLKLYSKNDIENESGNSILLRVKNNNYIDAQLKLNNGNAILQANYIKIENQSEAYIKINDIITTPEGTYGNANNIIVYTPAAYALKANKIAFDTPDPSDQTGIYARFA